MTSETVIAILEAADERLGAYMRERHYKTERALLNEVLDTSLANRLIRAVAMWRMAGRPGLGEFGRDCIACSVGNPGVYIKDGHMVCPHRPE